jgi:hypothetical protein
MNMGIMDIHDIEPLAVYVKQLLEQNGRSVRYHNVQSALESI